MSNLLPEDVVDLDRRMFRRLEQGKGLLLSPGDLDILAVSGALKVLHDVAEESMRELASQRTAERRRSIIKQANIGAPVAGRPVCSETESATEALARAIRTSKQLRRRASSEGS